MSKRKHFVNCVGYAYLDPAGQVIHSNLLRWEEVELKRDPKNPYDRNAIQVLDPDTGVRIGYIDKSSARDLAPWMDRGVRYKATVERPVVLEHGETVHPMMLRLEG